MAIKNTPTPTPATVTTPPNTKYNSMVIRGNVMWASLDKPNEMSNKYQLDLCNLSNESVEVLTRAGIEVKFGEGDKADKGFYVTPKATKPVRIVDAIKNPWLAELLIGNSSIINCLVKPYEWEFKGKSGVSLGLQAVQVLKHVNYDMGEQFKDESGFTDNASGS